MLRVSFSPVAEVHRDVLRLALDAGHLPTDDLHESGRCFFELSDEIGTIGFIGMECEGPDRLLRSLVVLSGRKRFGYGGLLVAHAEAVARQHDVERLHLLTTTAADFFRARGYSDAKRATAPDAIRFTAQFSTLCPGSAAYLVKKIA